MNPIMEYFKYEHLPEHLQTISKPIGDLARMMDVMIPDSAEKSAGLRKLLEAKDCLVRSAIGKTLDHTASARTILHVTVGSPDFEPTKEDLEFITELFMTAKTDPLGCVVATRHDIHANIVRVDGGTDVKVVEAHIDSIADVAASLENAEKHLPESDESNSDSKDGVGQS